MTTDSTKIMFHKEATTTMPTR